MFGVSNRLGIEEPWAAIVRGAEVDEKLLRADCSRELVSAQVPVNIVTMDNLPRNETGKIDRRQLAELVKQV